MLDWLWAKAKAADAAFWTILGSTVLALVDLLDYLPLDDLLAAMFGDSMRVGFVVAAVPLLVAFVRWRASRAMPQTYEDRLDETTPTEPF